jgi:DNA-binding MarR family transcriptional regulator
MDDKPRWQGMATDTDFSLWRVLDHTRFMIARSREMELAKYDLTPEQSHVLDILQESNGSTTINQLVVITQRQHHSISTLIDRMTKQGLVTKQKAGIDQRKYEVVITDKGKELVTKMTRDSIRIIFSGLSEEDKKRLHSYLSLLVKEAYRVLRRNPAPGITASGPTLVNRNSRLNTR